MRIAQLSQELEVLARIEGIDRALGIIEAAARQGLRPGARRSRARRCRGLVGRRSSRPTRGTRRSPWRRRSAPMTDAAAHEALLVLADFADLKSPWTSGHSRAVAALAGEACGPDGGGGRARARPRRSSPSRTPIWDKPGPLTRDERDRAETHALITDQLLRRVPYTAPLGPAAGAAHERLDGSGYHRRVHGAQLDEAQRVLAAADCYQAMISDRPHRPARQPGDGGRELRAMSGGRAARRRGRRAGAGRRRSPPSGPTVAPGRTHEPRGRGAAAARPRAHHPTGRRPAR